MFAVCRFHAQPVSRPQQLRVCIIKVHWRITEGTSVHSLGSVRFKQRTRETVQQCLKSSDRIEVVFRCVEGFQLPVSHNHSLTLCVQRYRCLRGEIIQQRASSSRYEGFIAMRGHLSLEKDQQDSGCVSIKAYLKKKKIAFKKLDGDGKVMSYARFRWFLHFAC